MNKKILLSLIVLCGLFFACSQSKQSDSAEVPVGTLEVVAELDINPGNVAVSKDGRVFMSVHPLRGQDLDLVEITGDSTYTAFPNEEFQEVLDTPLGVIVDKKDRLWVIDAGLNLETPRIFAFQVETGEELYRFEIPSDIAREGAFVQDLAIDETNEWVYLADFGDPGLIALDLGSGSFRKFRDLETMTAEDIDMVIDGEVQNFQGAPARIGINPVTLSEDRGTVFYGAMSGTKWYSLPTKAFRGGVSDEELKKLIEVAGPKPLSDGVATVADGRHYFTNIQEGSISVLENGELTTLIKDPKIDWPDNVRIGPDNWLYIAVNQLHKSPAFTGGEDEATLPYYVLRVKI